MNKKISSNLLIACAAVILFVSAIFIYMATSKNGGVASEQTLLDRFRKNTENNSLIPSPRPGIVKPISEAAAVSFLIKSTDDSVSYYDKNSGRVFRYDLGSDARTVISDNVLPGFIRTVWSPSGREVVSLFSMKDTGQYRYYNYATKKSSVLEPDISSVVFSPSGDRIAYFVASNVDPRVVIANPDGTVTKTILRTRLKNVQVFWPSENILAVSVLNSLSQTWQLFSLDMDGNLEKILSDVPDLSLKWSRDGSKLLFSYFGTGNLAVLSIYDRSNKAGFVLPLNTPANKCAWSADNSFILCGTSSGTSSDDIYLVDLETNLSNLVFTGSLASPRLVVQEMGLSLLDRSAVILNATDEKLYELDIEAK